MFQQKGDGRSVVKLNVQNSITKSVECAGKIGRPNKQTIHDAKKFKGVDADTELVEKRELGSGPLD